MSKGFAMTMDNIELEIATLDKLAPYMPEFERFLLAMLVDEFAQNFGEEGLKDLCAFIDFAIEADIKETTIKATLYHDISGRKDTLMLPRTNGYYKHFNEEK